MLDVCAIQPRNLASRHMAAPDRDRDRDLHGSSRVRPRDPEAVVDWHACQCHGIPFARAPDYGK
jgi:hypothetical protein